MRQVTDLGKWITEKYRSQVKFAEKVGAHPTMVSRWLTGKEGISREYQDKIRGMKYAGPWPREEAEETPAPAGSPLATSSEISELRGALRAHVEQWERGQEKVLQWLEALDRKLSQPRADAP